MKNEEKRLAIIDAIISNAENIADGIIKNRDVHVKSVKNGIAVYYADFNKVAEIKIE